MLHDQSIPGPYSAERDEMIAGLSDRPRPMASVAVRPRKRETDLIMEALLREYYEAHYLDYAARQ